MHRYAHDYKKYNVNEYSTVSLTMMSDREEEERRRRRKKEKGEGRKKRNERWTKRRADISPSDGVEPLEPRSGLIHRLPHTARTYQLLNRNVESARARTTVSHFHARLAFHGPRRKRCRAKYKVV